MRIGYARVSTADQNPDLQEDALQKAGCEKVFRDIASGAVDSRKGLSEAIEYARDGDTLTSAFRRSVKGFRASFRNVGPRARRRDWQTAARSSAQWSRSPADVSHRSAVAWRGSS